MDHKTGSTSKTNQVLQTLNENKQYIVKKKEAWYDKIISGLHLTQRKMDIFIIILVALFIGVILFAVLTK